MEETSLKSDGWLSWSTEDGRGCMDDMITGGWGNEPDEPKWDIIQKQEKRMRSNVTEEEAECAAWRETGKGGGVGGGEQQTHS